MKTGLSVRPNTWKEQSDAETFCSEGARDMEAQAYIQINEYQEIFFHYSARILTCFSFMYLKRLTDHMKTTNYEKGEKNIKEQETTTHMEKS